ncbi:hypothetical protein C5167_005148 [Papaver somniferum]|uniref:Anaphase-promoting complex subunit 4 WD40 domain-containing protein n=1 Tax=Papaver somniferum TaxID=3469 RepID=A0A4Y7J9M7_PAPSO|nr:hypothetical protein C5167_005148 [Papaver somniferum]
MPSDCGDQNGRRPNHRCFVNALSGHGDSVVALCFSADGRNLVTSCADGVARVFKLDNVQSSSFKVVKIHLPAGGQPTTVSFSNEDSSVVVAAQYSSGSNLYMYAEGNSNTSKHKKHEKPKSLVPEMKWLRMKVHQTRAIVTLAGTTANYDTAGGSPFIVSCSEGNDIIIWNGKSGKIFGSTDTNELKNSMARIIHNGRLIAAAAASSADVKIWEIILTKAGSVKEITGAMQLKGNESVVTWLCFSSNSEQIITTSKDGTIRIWNINVRHDFYQDPQILKHIYISPDGNILAATHGPILQWICAETGKVLETHYEAHDVCIIFISFPSLDTNPLVNLIFRAEKIKVVACAPKELRVGRDHKMVLATAGDDERVKLWVVPGDPPL